MAWRTQKKKGPKEKYWVYDRVLIEGQLMTKCFGGFHLASNADEKIRTLEEEKAKNKGNFIDYNATLWKYCDKYFEAPIKRKPGTLRIIKDAIKHIKRYFPEKMQLREITGDHVEEFIKWLSVAQDYGKAYNREAYNHTTIHMHMRNFSSILNYAKEKHVITENPAHVPLKNFGDPPGREFYLSFDEQERFYNVILKTKMRKPGRNIQMWKMIKTLYATGVRRNELLNMRKEHMISERKIEIPSRQVRNKENKNPTKSNMPYTVALNSEIAPFFQEVESGPIWPGWTTNSLNHQFRRMADLAGLPELVPHGMRHTFAKDTLQSGKTSLPVLQVMLNHQDIQSTMIYNRWAKNEEFLENVEALVRPNIKKVI